MQLEISEEEREILKRILEEAISTLRVELRRTQTRDYHDKLQREEQQLEALVGRLAGGG